MKAIPMSFKDACEFIRKNHRHHSPPRGWKFGLGVLIDGELVGCVIAGRPVSRFMDDGFTCEVTRLCTDGSKNVCSFLYASIRRAAFALGYTRVITYILESESGTSLKASGFRFERLSSGGKWSRKNRPRKDSFPTCKKQLWVMP